MKPGTAAVLLISLSLSACAVPGGTALRQSGPVSTELAGEDDYPWHTDIVATTFWVGEILDPNTSDGSQELSTYDSHWMESYGGCDGVVIDGVCNTERRTAENGYAPLNMEPKENYFYLDLPFDDLNNPQAFATRAKVIPWADHPGYAGKSADKSFSYMKNRWVRLRKGDRVCYGQVQDAGPNVYDDAAYVFGNDDPRPANTRFNGAGLDVSPALNGCLKFSQLNGSQDRVDWQFVEAKNVPEGPWKKIVTTSPVQHR
ncbi:hypothetical protein [Arthrobacter crystallopoietes]|uniref:Lipoprotein n=1 Tax=Crystallibacter crystallopoietes TaxID=37928 RepID=A0A1H1FW24_9MICC|nr:hypothetical protein [Arthrobacter crystallopoietes]AUI52898.1 hypothetical protein AC20117_21000 [Arthrobacter crystallopoietes]SDR04868.1 hypothetical protein SAMN04489742_3674 [Arthrobacter crystallopoietes]